MRILLKETGARKVGGQEGTQDGDNSKTSHVCVYVHVL